MRTWLGLLLACLGCCAASADDAVARIIQAPRQNAGLGRRGLRRRRRRTWRRLPSFVEQTPWTIFCRGAASPGLDKIRDWAGRKALLGRRVYVADDDGASLWLAGDMADAVWVAPSVGRSAVRTGDPARAASRRGLRGVGTGYRQARSRGRGRVAASVSRAGQQRGVARPRGAIAGRVAFPDASGVRGDAQSDAVCRRADFLLLRAHRLPRARRTAAEHADGPQRLQRPAPLESSAGPALRRPQRRQAGDRQRSGVCRGRDPLDAGCGRPDRSAASSASRPTPLPPATRTGNGSSRTKTRSGRRSARRTPAWLPTEADSKWATGPGTWRTSTTGAIIDNFGAARTLGGLSVSRDEAAVEHSASRNRSTPGPCAWKADASSSWRRRSTWPLATRPRGSSCGAARPRRRKSCSTPSAVR